MLTKAAVFTDHMVLQRRKPIPVWGTAKAGQRVKVSLGDDVRETFADENGNWKTFLPPREAGGPLTLTISCNENTLTCEDVLVGEVWLAGGQSNMEMALKDCKDGKKEIANSCDKNVRFYNVPRCAVLGEELTKLESESSWQICTPQTSGEISAVAWFFAVQISESQNVPVGIIDCYWGGSSVSTWISREKLEKTSAGREYLDSYAALVGDKTAEQYYREMKEYDKLWQAWNSRVEHMRKQDPHITWAELNKLCGICPWPQPAGDQSPYRPSGIYETMLKRVSPYALRGFIYYQGEEDTARYSTYDEMMSSLIEQWRTDWCDLDLPFLFVQLPMYCSAEEYSNNDDNKNWAEIREKQWKVSRTVRNTAMAVLTDHGEFDNIHPLDKRTVGTRLALLARNKVYGELVAADAPRVQSIRRNDKCVEVRFAHTAGSLFFKGDCLEGFELAGKDGIYHKAKGKLCLDTVVLWADEVPAPEGVRYAWTNYGTANLYNAVGLPAISFRTGEEFIIV